MTSVLIAEEFWALVRHGQYLLRTRSTQLNLLNHSDIYSQTEFPEILSAHSRVLLAISKLFVSSQGSQKNRSLSLKEKQRWFISARNQGDPRRERRSSATLCSNDEHRPTVLVEASIELRIFENFQ
ncbi:unnamed protein product [Fasciola hepatica]|uniref:Uncharacterized protein n=1 Tax=Fasciola hepatica TaxID=6192 RepID=A0ABC9HHQ5_FASHE